ncbi:MAG: xanthine dehydrogenase family protein molybdopterin-binding subunit [Burkholderiaceae bacterium]|nr:xanthine dehydrogenase family protein molybdopterin-binding subunit [Burkholderiaceae bacterium]
MTFTKGRASSRNFNSYRMMRASDMPRIDVQIVQTGGPLGGVGEPGVPPVAPAVANALARLTGQRIRSLPMFPAAAAMGDD